MHKMQLQLASLLSIMLIFSGGLYANTELPVKISTPKQVKEFKIFDALVFKNKPNLSTYGIEEINIIYEGNLWDKSGKNKGVISEDSVIRSSIPFKNKSVEVVLDIETWDEGKGESDEKLQIKIQKYLKVLGWYKKHNKDNLIGFYGLVPRGDYWRAIKSPEHPKHQEWVAENDKHIAIVNAVDILYPSLYTFYKDQEQWKLFAKAQLLEARRIANGKPVYAFIWPQYHVSNRLLKYNYVDKAYWLAQLELVEQYADGVVLWGGMRDEKGDNWRDDWDENKEWWQATKEFIAKRKQPR